MDPPALGCLPLGRCQSRGSRKMAEDSLLQKDRPYARTGEQGENSQHHECALLTRYSMGVDGQQSNHQRPSKCKAAEGTRCSDARGDCGNSGRTAQSASDHDRTGCFYRTASRRTHRPPLGGRGFPGTGSSRPSVGCCDGGGSTENGGIAERRSVGRANCRVAFRLAADLPVSRSGRLGVCFAGNERETTVLARYAMALLREACVAAGQNHQTRNLSHVPAHVRHAPMQTAGRIRRWCRNCFVTPA